jgi:hypothetical protein
MKAPTEVEFILPFLDYFRGRPELQNRLLRESGYSIEGDPREFSKLLLALTLQNRFMAFYDWFDREIPTVKTLDDLALRVFPVS